MGRWGWGSVVLLNASTGMNGRYRVTVLKDRMDNVQCRARVFHCALSHGGYLGATVCCCIAQTRNPLCTFYSRDSCIYVE